MDFRSLIKKECAERGITQVQLARILETTPVSLATTLSSESVTTRKLEKIANVFGKELFIEFLTPEQAKLRTEKRKGGQGETICLCPACGERLKITAID